MTAAHDTAALGEGLLAHAPGHPGQTFEDAAVTTAEQVSWPPGDGEMARRIRCHDWAATPLGSLDGWPQRLQAVVELVLASPLVSSVVCEPGHLLIYNDAAARLYGERHPRALGRPLPETFADGWPTVEPLYARAFAGETVHVPAQPLDVGSDGGEVFDAYLTPIRGPEGRIDWVHMTGFEIGARLAAEKERDRRARQLRDSEVRFRAFVTASSDVIFHMGPDWSQMRELDGQGFLSDTLEPSETWMSRYIHPDDQPAVQAAIERAVRTRTMFELEHPVRRVDGSLGWALSRAIPILDDRGEIVEWLGAASDVTLRKQTEAALREADRRKDEFLAMLAHELRNPLAPIVSALRLLRSNGAGTDPAALRATIERQVGRLVRLVDDLMDVSRISRGTVELRRERLDLRDVLKMAVETSGPAIERGHHAFALALPDEPLPVDGDAVRLTQVVTNLLNNAARYTDEGGHIELTARRDGEEAVVTVRDDGIGLAPDQLPRLFEPFTQLHPSQARSHGGLGIGLNLSQWLARMHGGSLAAASDGPGRGSIFTVRLPLAAPAAAPAPVVAQSQAAAGLQAQRVLVVDDNRDAAETLALVLFTLGAKTRVESDGASALALLQRWRPSAVLLDLGMPGLDGYEVARRIRADRALDGIMLVALTGWGQAEDRRRTREAGFDHHLTKPVDLDALQALLAALPASTIPRNAKP